MRTRSAMLTWVGIGLGVDCRLRLTLSCVCVCGYVRVTRIGAVRSVR